MPQVFTLDSPHSPALHGLCWPAPNARAVVALVHGHGEHIARYDHVGQALNQAGIALLGHDLIGHGDSPGKRGHFPSYDQVLDSLEALLSQAQRLYPGAALFLMGHSMGGNLVANFGLRRRPALAGVILSAPWLELAFAPSALDLTLARLMKGVYPAFTQSSKLDADALSRDVMAVKAYREDPKVHDQVSPGLFLPVVEAGQYALQHAAEWSLPLYAYHGSADRITSPEATERFARSAGGGDATFRLWPDGYHELHHDLDQAAVLQALTAWVLARTQAG